MMDFKKFDDVLACKHGYLRKITEAGWRVDLVFRAVDIEGEAVRPILQFEIDPNSLSSQEAFVFYGDERSAVTVEAIVLGQDLKYIQEFSCDLSFQSGAFGTYNQALMLRSSQ